MDVLIVVFGVTAIAAAVWWARRCCTEPESAERTGSAPELAEYVEAEPADVQLQRCGQVTFRGDLADDMQTEILPLPREFLPREDEKPNLLLLQRLLAGVKRL
ncbi:hypothetical protein [Saccharopolyspora taberi]|uniref:Uncharacterized protein n=1 Tax=Saccharopolyspora taberi TaxID=60895 RepID=A0ABN3VLJ2_9PSEU